MNLSRAFWMVHLQQRVVFVMVSDQGNSFWLHVVDCDLFAIKQLGAGTSSNQHGYFWHPRMSSYGSIHYLSNDRVMCCLCTDSSIPPVLNIGHSQHLCLATLQVFDLIFLCRNVWVVCQKFMASGWFPLTWFSCFPTHSWFLLCMSATMINEVRTSYMDAHPECCA